MLFKCLAVAAVFAVCFFAPIAVSRVVTRAARNSVILTDMSSLKNWAEIYELRAGTYEGLGDDMDVQRVLGDIKAQGGDCVLYENSKNYCAKASFKEIKKKDWCIDSFGYSGSSSMCSEGNIKCH